MKFLYIPILFILSSAFLVNAECVLKMAYKEGNKMPLIAKKPDNSGAYLELFSRAAERIGCRLEIVRLPKKRLHRQLEQGKLDFYPGASFSEKRATYLCYIENGFPTGEYGITSADMPDIHDYQQLKELGLTWLMEMGGSKTELADRLNVKTRYLGFADIETARRVISKGRNIFYVADKELVDYYLKNKEFVSFKEAGLKVHNECCGGDYPMYMGFSRTSHHFRKRSNPKYDETKKLSPTNFPIIADSGCVAFRLGQALQELKASGETLKIYQKYFSE